LQFPITSAFLPQCVPYLSSLWHSAEGSLSLRRGWPRGRLSASNAGRWPRSQSMLLRDLGYLRGMCVRGNYAEAQYPHGYWSLAASLLRACIRVQQGGECGSSIDQAACSGTQWHPDESRSGDDRPRGMPHHFLSRCRGNESRRANDRCSPPLPRPGKKSSEVGASNSGRTSMVRSDEASEHGRIGAENGPAANPECPELSATLNNC
jgi:hypothetical protein